MPVSLIHIIRYYRTESLKRSQICELYQYNFEVEYTLNNKRDDDDDSGDDGKDKKLANIEQWWTHKVNKSICMQVQTGLIHVLKCFRNCVWTLFLQPRVILYSCVQTYFGTSCQVVYEPQGISPPAFATSLMLIH